MSKPIVTLPPSKCVIAESAAQIYAAYISAGYIKKDNAEKWMKRAIRESIAIARAVDSAILSDNELPADEPVVIEEQGAAGESSEPPEAEDPEDLVEAVLSSTMPPKKAPVPEKDRKPGRLPQPDANDGAQSAAEAAERQRDQIR